MTVRKVLLAACAAALTTTPAWALPGRAPSNEGTGHAPSTVPAGPPATTPAGPPAVAGRSQNAPGSGNPTGNTGHGKSGGQHGKSHRCVAHKVAYVAAGTLVSQTLVLDGGTTPSAAASDTRTTHPARPTYSGDVAIAVTRTNRWARGDKGTTKTYTLVRARVLFGLADTNNDGSVGLDDLAAGDRVKVIGKVTVLRRGCDQTGFTPTIAIQKLIVHAPAKQQQPAG